MKVVADGQRRVTLPEPVHAGDVFELQPHSENGFVLTRLERPPAPATLVSKDGALLLRSSGVITWEATREALDQIP